MNTQASSDYAPGDRVHVPYPDLGCGTVLAVSGDHVWVDRDAVPEPITFQAGQLLHVHNQVELRVWTAPGAMKVLPMGESPGHRNEGWRCRGSLVLHSDNAVTLDV